MPNRSALLRRPWAFVTTAVGFAMLTVYITKTVGQETSILLVLPWAVLMAISAVAALAAAHIEDRRLARNLMLGAGVLFGLLGALSIFSIGLGFLLAAALAIVAASQLSDS